MKLEKFAAVVPAWMMPFSRFFWEAPRTFVDFFAFRLSMARVSRIYRDSALSTGAHSTSRRKRPATVVFSG
jgi:hypothetical protein